MALLMPRNEYPVIQKIRIGMTLAFLLAVLIAVAGCTSADSSATGTAGNSEGLLNATASDAVVFGQMHVKMLEGTNEVFEYILSGESDDKTEFLFSMVEAGVLNDEIRAVSDHHLLKEEYDAVDSSRTALIVSALAVIEEYETNGNVSASGLQAFEDDVDLMKSAFDEYADASYATLPGGGNDPAVSLLKMQEELLETVGESLEYVTLGNVEEKEEFYAGMDRFMAEAEAFNDTAYLRAGENVAVANRYQAMMDAVTECRSAADILFSAYEADKMLSGEDFDAYEVSVDTMKAAYDTLMASVLATV